MAVPLILSDVPNVNPYIQYVATNGQTVFPYPFPITQDSDLVAVANGVTLPTDSGYTLSGQGNDTGGNLTFTLGRTAGDIITLYRNIAIQRISQIAQNSGFSSTVFNAEYNNIYLIMQQIKAASAQFLQIPNTNSPAPVTTLTPGAYANKYLFFDANGNPTPAVLTSSGTLTQGIISALTGPQTPTEAAVGVVPVNFANAQFNVLRYGNNTVPGTTDMTLAFQNASAVAAQSGGSIYVPAGKYKIAGTIGGTINFPIRIVGDGMGVTTITQTVDAHLFSYTCGNNSTRVIVENLLLLAGLGSAMASGAAVNVVGASGGGSASFNPIVMRNVAIYGATSADEFKSGVSATSVSTSYMENVLVKGTSGATSASSVGFNFAATSSPCVDLQFIACQAFQNNIGFNFASSTSPGIEGIMMWGCQATGCNFGLLAVNSLGINVYAPPQIELHGCQMQCTRSPVTISNFVDITVKGGLFYSTSNTVGDAFFNCTSVQNVMISANTSVLSPGDIPVLRLSGPAAATACGNGELDGFFQGKAGSALSLVQAVGYISNIKVRGVMNGYASWLPSALSPTYFQSTFASLASASQTAANPGVFTTATQAFVAGQPVVLTGAAPGGFALNQVYYVIAAGLTTTACQLAAVPGGTGIQCTASAACTVLPISSLGGLICKPHDISPVDADHTIVTLNPSGGAAGGGTLNFQNIQCPRVNINATAGNITGATPFEPGHRMTMIFPSTGATLTNSASFQMPGLANYAIANTNTALTIDNLSASNWLRTALAT